MSITYPTLVNFSHYRHLRGIWIHSIITYFQTHSILTNKPNFGDDKMNINLDMKSIYKILSAGSGQKTKPIQTQLKPKQTQFKPIQSQFKANLMKRQNYWKFIDPCYTKTPSKTDGNEVDIYTLLCHYIKVLSTEFGLLTSEVVRRLKLKVQHNE